MGPELSEMTYYDYLFNICTPADDPLNQINGVPGDFEHLNWNANQAFRVENRFRAGKPICSTGATEWDLGIEGTVSVP